MTVPFDTDLLGQRGFAVARGLIDPAECRALAALWPEKSAFRKHIVMQRHGYGQGEYQYFTYPLPDAGRAAAPGALSGLAAGRQSLERGARARAALSADARGAGYRSVTKPARRGRRRCCCATAPATTTACTAISTARWCFRCRRRCC